MRELAAFEPLSGPGRQIGSPRPSPCHGTEEVSLLRRLRIVASTQLSLDVGDKPESFWDLPEATQTAALALLARMIAKGVVVEESGQADG